MTAGGGVFAFGDAQLHGGKREDAARPSSRSPRTPSGNGYWLAAKDGTVGAFGDAPVLGSVKAPTAVLVRC